MLVREYAPAHQITVVSSRGFRTRWAADELDASKVPSGLTWSTSVPGGADTLRCTLSRDPERAHDDLDLLSEIQVSRNGGRTMRFRLDEAPKVSGDQMAVEPAAQGYRAALEDRADVRALFVDRSLADWGNISRSYNILLLETGGYYPVTSGSGVSDNADGLPALLQELNFSGTSKPYVGNLYDAGEGLRIGSIYYDATHTPAWTPPTDLTASIAVHTADSSTTGSSTGDIEGTSSGTFTPTSAQRFASIEFYYDNVAVADDATYAMAWRKLAVYGDHELTKQGSDPGGFYTGQMLEWLVNSKTSLHAGTVEDGTFLHPHAVYRDPSTALSIVENLTRYEPLYDWFVYDDFNFQRRGTYGKRWRARVGPSGLRSAGQDMARLWNEIAVKVDDPLYGSAMVGPSGSGYSNESDYLRDSDPDNPANRAGITRRAILDIGTGTIEGAKEVGKRFLDETKRLDNSGQCELIGFVEDEAGVAWPVDEVRAGDEIQFSDAADTSWRRISATSYNADSLTNSLSLDSPAQTMDGLLARLQAVLVPLN